MRWREQGTPPSEKSVADRLARRGQKSRVFQLTLFFWDNGSSSKLQKIL